MRAAPRLHLPETPSRLQDGATLPMTEAQAHYLGRVLRSGPGDAVRLFNARDGEWEAAIERLPRRGEGSFVIRARMRPPLPEPGPTLLFAPLKRDATDLVVRMATELGASSIRPVLTERTNSFRINVERLRLIAIEATEQCERLSVPVIGEPQPLARILSDWPEDSTLWAAIERLEQSADKARPAPAPRPPGAWLDAPSEALLIGPEGGFAPAELDVLRARHFVTPISLGSRILKAETAVVAGLACLQAARETWGFETSPITGSGPQGPPPQAMPAEPDVQPR